MEENRNAGRERKKRRMRRIIAAEIMVLFLVVLGAGILARYISSYKKKAEMLSSSFHFTSNCLEEEEETAYTISDWMEGITILLYNYEKENVALIAEEGISYKVDAGEGWDVSVTDETGSAVVYPEEGLYSMPGGGGRRSQTLKLVYTGTGTPEKVSVKVTAVSPYSKTLQADFTLSGKADPDYTVEDKGKYCLVTVRANNYSGTITVNWDSVLFSPDNTNPIMEDWLNVNKTGSFNAEPYTAYELIFVKNADKEYSATSGTGSTVLVGR